MTAVSTTTPTPAAAATTVGNLFRERGKICIEVGARPGPLRKPTRGGQVQPPRALAQQGELGRAYTKSCTVRQRDVLRKFCVHSPRPLLLGTTLTEHPPETQQVLWE